MRAHDEMYVDAGLASRPAPGPRPEVGGYGRGIPSGWCGGAAPSDGSPSSPAPPLRCDWRAVARTALRPDPMILSGSGRGLPPCWRSGRRVPRAAQRRRHSPSWTIRQYLVGPTVGVLGGGRNQGRHDQMLLRRQPTAKSDIARRGRRYLRGQSGAFGGVPGGWSDDGPARHRFRQRAIDTATSG
jgi:hypothetical protein